MDPTSLIPLRELPHRLPRRPNGRMVSLSAIYRWIARGCLAPDGQRIRLAVTRIGGSTFVDPAALDLFTSRLSGQPTEVEPPRSSAARRRAVEAAEKQLAAQGV
jgi:hypothetical protein